MSEDQIPETDTSKGFTVQIINSATGEIEWEDDVPTTMLDTLEWWIQTSVDDFISTVPKIDEYGGKSDGSADLRIMGRNLGELLGWDDASDAVLQELAVWFYAQGKIGRLISNYSQKVPGKADTWHDTTIYSLMARRLQQSGNWP